MSAFQHILVPLDFTEKNERALDVVAALAGAPSSRVVLLHIVEAIAQTPDDPLTTFYKSLEDDAKQKLSEYATSLQKAGFEVEARVLIGDPARGIVSEAESLGAELIVLSSHPIQPTEGKEGWATISYQVSVLCRCAVLLVK